MLVVFKFPNVFLCSRAFVCSVVAGVLKEHLPGLRALTKCRHIIDGFDPEILIQTRFFLNESYSFDDRLGRYIQRKVDYPRFLADLRTELAG